MLLGALAGASIALGSVARAQDDAPPPVSGLGDAHAVAPGDTLWDLCAKYLNSPWYWPKIWSYNPQLTNPHWIFPGNEIRFYPGDEQLPTEIDVGRGLAIEDDDLIVPGVLTDEELVTTVGTIETGRTTADSVVSTFATFLSTDELDRAGRLEGSISDGFMLTDFDLVYVEGNPSLQRGDKVGVYRASRRIKHPVTGENYGYALELVAGIEVTETYPEVASARIFRSFRPVERGDLVAPLPESWGLRVQPTPATTTVKGYVLETAGDVLGAIGEHHLLYLDRGRNHGVQVGNLFTVYHRGDRYTGRTKGFPNEPVGRVMVLDVREEASTALIVSSNFEINVGDKVEMTPEG